MPANLRNKYIKNVQLQSVQKAAKLLKLHSYVHVTYELEGPDTEQ